jgi:DNA-binding MarR family transcriptional regulator
MAPVPAPIRPTGLRMSGESCTGRKGPIDRVLEVAGLVSRRTHPTGRRSIVVGLTPAGRDPLEALQARRAGFETRLRAEFGDARLEDIRQSLRSLRERMEACSAP